MLVLNISVKLLRNSFVRLNLIGLVDSVSQRYSGGLETRRFNLKSRSSQRIELTGRW